jgi:hypothetical protein
MDRAFILEGMFILTRCGTHPECTTFHFHHVAPDAVYKIFDHPGTIAR